MFLDMHEQSLVKLEGATRHIGTRLGLSSGAENNTATAVSSTLVFSSTSAVTADNSVDTNTFAKEIFTVVSLQMRGDRETAESDGSEIAQCPETSLQHDELSDVS